MVVRAFRKPHCDKPGIQELCPACRILYSTASIQCPLLPRLVESWDLETRGRSGSYETVHALQYVSTCTILAATGKRLHMHGGPC